MSMCPLLFTTVTILVLSFVFKVRSYGNWKFEPEVWCGGGDSNPGTPTGQGPKPSAHYCSAPLTWLHPSSLG